MFVQIVSSFQRFVDGGPAMPGEGYDGETADTRGAAMSSMVNTELQLDSADTVTGHDGLDRPQ